MRNLILAGVTIAALSAPALADTYPVSGAWGPQQADKGPMNCVGKDTITFTGNLRHDSKGGVTNFRNRSVTADGPSRYRLVDEFATGQISARTTYTLSQTDEDHIVIHQSGHTRKLQRCQ